MTTSTLDAPAPARPRRLPGRSDDRLARAGAASAAMAAASGATLVTGLALVPLTIGHLGVARYGLLATLVAGATLLEPLDLGVGSALVTLLGGTDAAGARTRGDALVRAAARLLAVVAVVCVPLGLLLAWHAPWGSALGAPQAAHEAAAGVAVLAIATAIGLPLGIVDRVNLGMQRGHRVGLTTVVGSMLSLVAVALAAHARAGVPALLAAYLAGPLVARAGATCLLLLRWRPGLRAAPPDAGSPGPTLARTARLFFVLQLAVAVAYSSDQFVVALVLGAEAVPEYAVAARLFAVVTAGTALLLRPLWPAYAAAAAVGDMAWVRRTLRRSLRVVFVLSAAGSAVLVLVGPAIVRVLSDDAVVPRTPVFAAFAVWSVVMATGNAVAIALNGLAVVRMQVVVASVMAVCNLAASIVLANVVGVAGVLWGSVGAYVLCVGVPYARFVASLGRTEAR